MWVGRVRLWRGEGGERKGGGFGGSRRTLFWVLSWPGFRGGEREKKGIGIGIGGVFHLVSFLRGKSSGRS